MGETPDKLIFRHVKDQVKDELELANFFKYFLTLHQTQRNQKAIDGKNNIKSLNMHVLS